MKPTPALAGCKGQKLLHHAQVKVCIHYSVKPEKNPTSPLVFVQGERKTPALEFLVFLHLSSSSSSSSSSLLHPFIDGAFSKYYLKIQRFAGVKRSISRRLQSRRSDQSCAPRLFDITCANSDMASLHIRAHTPKAAPPQSIVLDAFL